MPFRYTIVDERLVRIDALAEVSVDAWFGVLDAACADPRVRPGFDVLYDGTKVSQIPDVSVVRAWVNRLARATRECGGRA